MLNLLNFSVITARDGHEAVSIFSRIKDYIDMVILDMNMPGMDGREAGGKMLEMDANARILLSVDHDANRPNPSAWALPFKAIIQKPCSLSQLRETLEDILSKNTRPVKHTMTIKKPEWIDP